MRHGTRGVVLAAMLLHVVAAPRAGQQDDYRHGVETWRAEREAGLKADDGWLTVAGLFFLHQGDNSFGAGPLNDIVLPEGPERAGRLPVARSRGSRQRGERPHALCRWRGR